MTGLMDLTWGISSDYKKYEWRESIGGRKIIVNI